MQRADSATLAIDVLEPPFKHRGNTTIYGCVAATSLPGVTHLSMRDISPVLCSNGLTTKDLQVWKDTKMFPAWFDFIFIGRTPTGNTNHRLVKRVRTISANEERSIYSIAGSHKRGTEIHGRDTPSRDPGNITLRHGVAAHSISTGVFQPKRLNRGISRRMLLKH